MRRAARVDENQAQIISALRAAGAYVWIVGLPVDLLVGYRNHTYLVEIKTDSIDQLAQAAIKEDQGMVLIETLRKGIRK
jgi:hypothetical protein